MPTQKWLDSVVKSINLEGLNPLDSKFMMVFFSSMDMDIVRFFRDNKKQISSFSGQNFHIFTPFIDEDHLVDDQHARHLRDEFRSIGIPIKPDPTFIFFKLDTQSTPKFYAGFVRRTATDFQRLLTHAIDISVETNDIDKLTYRLGELFNSRNIIEGLSFEHHFVNTISSKLPSSTAFISYSSRDRQFASRLHDELAKDSSLKLWIDSKMIQLGQNIREQVSNTLAQSDYLLLIISESSQSSDWVKFEIGQFMAQKQNPQIIPILIGEKTGFSEPIDDFLNGVLHVDFRNNANWDDGVNALRKVLSTED